ncbi:MAG: hypothetical protein WC784_04375 [Candidatus Shapirobacteria bacterium]|jgi:hypothetical protein
MVNIEYLKSTKKKKGVDKGDYQKNLYLKNTDSSFAGSKKPNL